MSDIKSHPISSSTSFHTPILLILLFNRSDHAERLLEKHFRAFTSPSLINVSIDGPRDGNAVNDLYEVNHHVSNLSMRLIGTVLFIVTFTVNQILVANCPLLTLLIGFSRRTNMASS